MKEYKDLISFIIPFYKKYIRHEFVIVLILLMLLGLQIVIPLGFRNVIDAIAQRVSISEYKNELLLYSGMFIFSIIATWIYSIYVVWLGESLIIDVTSQALKTILHTKRSFWMKYDANDLLTRITQDIVSFKTLIVEYFHGILMHSFLLLGNIIMLFYLNLNTGLIVLVVLPLIMVITKKGNDYINLTAIKIRILSSKFMYVFRRSFDHQPLMKSWNLMPHYLQKYSENASEMKKTQISFAKKNQVVVNLLNLASFLFTTFVMLLILYNDYKNSYLSIGMLFTILIYSGKVVDSGLKISTLIVTSKLNQVSVLRVKELLNNSEDISSNITQESNNLTHSFFKNEMKSGIKIPKKNKFIVNLHSGNGTGKTTLALVLAGFDDLGDYQFTEIWFLIPADINLFEGTLLDNIKIISNLSPTEDEIIIILDNAGLASLLTVFSNGFNTLVYDKNETLSRGQKQIAVLISAIVKNPSHIIIDEGFSAIDIKIKELIREPLIEWFARRKAIIIEHDNYLTNQYSMKLSDVAL